MQIARYFQLLSLTASLRYKAGLLLAVGLCLTLPNAAVGQSVTGQEYAVKTGFIYNFINFVTWPEQVFSDANQPLVICLLAENADSEVLYQLNGKNVRGRPIRVVAYNNGACVTESQVLFVASQDLSAIRQALNRAKGSGILTIGEVDGFVQMGGIINFFVESNRLRFQINLDAAQREALKMSSQLLRSAQIVREERP